MCMRISSHCIYTYTHTCMCVVMWLQDCCEAALVSLACQLSPSALHMKGPGCVGGQEKEKGGWGRLCIYLHLVGICIVLLIRITVWRLLPFSLCLQMWTTVGCNVQEYHLYVKDNANIWEFTVQLMSFMSHNPKIHLANTFISVCVSSQCLP